MHTCVKWLSNGENTEEIFSFLKRSTRISTRGKTRSAQNLFSVNYFLMFVRHF